MSLGVVNVLLACGWSFSSRSSASQPQRQQRHPHKDSHQQHEEVTTHVCDIGTTYASYHDASRPSHNIEYKIYDYYSEKLRHVPRIQDLLPQQRRNDVNNKKVTTPTTTTKQRQQHEARAIHDARINTPTWRRPTISDRPQKPFRGKEER